MYILDQYSGLFNKEIGNVFGVSASAVGKATIRVEKKIREEKWLKKKVENLILFSRSDPNESGPMRTGVRLPAKGWKLEVKS